MALPRKQNSEDYQPVPISFVPSPGLPSPGPRSPSERRAEKRGETRRVANGGAAQRVRQKASRQRRRSDDAAPGCAVRTCVGCGASGSADELLRTWHNPDLRGLPSGTPQVMVDLGGKPSAQRAGRGAWIHPRLNCIHRACVRGFAKAFAAPVQVTADEIVTQITRAAERRLAGLLLAGHRSRQLVYGREAVKEVLGETSLVILAKDAQSVAKDGELQRAGLSGKVLCWSTKEQLGRWLGRSEVGALALLDGAMAEAARRAIALTELAANNTTSRPLGEENEEHSAEQAPDAKEMNSGAELESSARLESSAGASGGAGRDEELSEVR